MLRTGVQRPEASNGSHFTALVALSCGALALGLTLLPSSTQGAASLYATSPAVTLQRPTMQSQAPYHVRSSVPRTWAQRHEEVVADVPSFAYGTPATTPAVQAINVQSPSSWVSSLFLPSAFALAAFGVVARFFQGGQSGPAPLRLSEMSTYNVPAGGAWGMASAAAETVSEPATEEPAKPTRPARVLSGVQPTGKLTLGNYLGAIKQWVDLQNDPETNTDSLFCVVDLHAITAPHDPKELAEQTRQAAAVYLAAGLDPEKCTIFVQSHVRAHSELCWLLSCATPMNWMERMIQYKEKSQKLGMDVGLGLFSYPVLMAADILLYQTDLVPVGSDQTQHIELTRDVAGRFNAQYAKKMKKVTKKSRVFREPKAMIVAEGARVMSLTDGTSKMSKSAENDNSRINLLDPPELIRKKFKRCKTDTFVGLEWDNPERPECQNLLTIYQAVTGKSKDEVIEEVGDMNWGTFKGHIAEAVIAHLEPIQTRYAEIMADPEYLDQVLLQGGARANAIAEASLNDAYAAMGFMPRPQF